MSKKAIIIICALAAIAIAAGVWMGVSGALVTTDVTSQEGKALANAETAAVTDVNVAELDETEDETDGTEPVLLKDRPWDDHVLYYPDGELIPRCSSAYYVVLTGSEHVKQCLIDKGEMPEDNPSLTLKDARRIFNKIKEECDKGEVPWKDVYGGFNAYIIDKLNEVAGAPDYNGGSGITRIYYYIDGDPDRLLSILTCWESKVTYLNRQEGVLEVLIDPADYE